MKKYKVQLFRAPRCIRGWLAYLKNSGQPTVVVEIMAETGAKAKNSAITAANNAFRGVRIVDKNYTDPLWGLNNFPVVKYTVEQVERSNT
jgi:hypothetical protein